jgi:hypothetical protein
VAAGGSIGEDSHADDNKPGTIEIIILMATPHAEKNGREIVLSPNLKLIATNGLGFRLVFFGGLPALGLQLCELLSGKNSLRLLQELVPAFLGAAVLDAIGLPGLDLRLLIRRKVKRG